MALKLSRFPSNHSGFNIGPKLASNLLDQKDV